MRTLLRVLVIGFAAVIALLAAAAIIAVNDARSIAASAAGLVNNQLVIARLLDEVQREQEVLNTAFYRLSRAPDLVDRQRVLADLDQTDNEIRQIVQEERGRPNEEAWDRLERTTLDFSKEARQLLLNQEDAVYSSRDLFAKHEQVTTVVARLVDMSYANAVETRHRMDQQSDRLTQESKLLFGGGLLVALVFAAVTVRIAARVFRQMESQTGELSRVSFRMLETQESTARRFSHELHDELGGSLTAIKSQSAGDRARIPTDLARLEDCDQAGRRIDLIMCASFRSFCARRSSTISASTPASAGWRIASGNAPASRSTIDPSSTAACYDETETHLFRIVQEALTNVARHSGATRSTIHLRTEARPYPPDDSRQREGLADRRITAVWASAACAPAPAAPAASWRSIRNPARA